MDLGRTVSLIPYRHGYIVRLELPRADQMLDSLPNREGRCDDKVAVHVKANHINIE